MCTVQVLIYVFDIESRELSKDMEYYASCLSAVKQNSKNAKIFCLVHKMDLIPEEQRDPVFRQRERELMRLAQPLGIANGQGAAFSCHSLLLRPPGMQSFRPGLLHVSWRRASAAHAPVAAHGAPVSARQSRRCHWL